MFPQKQCALKLKELTLDLFVFLQFKGFKETHKSSVSSHQNGKKRKKKKNRTKNRLSAALIHKSASALQTFSQSNLGVMSVASYLTEFMLSLHPCLKGWLHLSQLFVLWTEKHTHPKLLDQSMNQFVMHCMCVCLFEKEREGGNTTRCHIWPCRAFLVFFLPAVAPSEGFSL